MDYFEVARNIIFDSDEEELIANKRPRWIRERIEHFDDLDDMDFARRLRLSKRSALEILDLIDYRLEFPSYRNNAISPINQFLLCLRFYATGCTQLSAADFSGVSEASANRIVHKITAAIASLYQEYVYFLRNDLEIRQTQRDFYNIARFPRVIGAVDGSYIKIRLPGGEHAEYFRNRKGYMSINSQGICNANLEFTDVVARWPGSTHDITIFDSCRQRALLEQNHYVDAILLADSGYTTDRVYLMTPLENVRTVKENLYNESQVRTRNPVQRIFGVWKRRFPILALGIYVRLNKALPIIVATAVLHNILKRRGDPQPPDDENIQLPMPWNELIEYGQIHFPVINQPRNQRVTDPYRQELINNYFKSLNAVHDGI